MSEEEEIVRRVRMGIAGWRGPSGSPALARYALAGAPRTPVWARATAAIAITLLISAAGLSAAVGVQELKARLSAAPAAAPATEPTSQPTATAEPTTAPTAEAAPTAEPTAAPTHEPTAPPEHEPTPPPEHEPTPPPEK